MNTIETKIDYELRGKIKVLESIDFMFQFTADRSYCLD